MPEAEVRFAERDGKYVAFTVFGTGPVDLVVLQSRFPIDLMWELPPLASFMESLGRLARVIAFDARGNGASDLLPGAETSQLEQAFDDLIAVLDAAESDRPALLDLANSSGTAFAAMYPDRVRSLMVANLRASFPEMQGLSDSGSCARRGASMWRCAVTEPAAEGATDRVLATVLFTDIVASTEQLAAQGDGAWRQLLDEHDKQADRIVREHRGRFVRSTGDGILATFDGPARAVRCAAALLATAAQQGIMLRAGLHTAEIELRPPDIAGIAVHTASRIADLTGPAEILVSRTVLDLTAGSGLDFEPRGDHQLKGVPGTWAIFAAQPRD